MGSKKQKKNIQNEEILRLEEKQKAKNNIQSDDQAIKRAGSEDNKISKKIPVKTTKSNVISDKEEKLPKKRLKRFSTSSKEISTTVDGNLKPKKRKSSLNKSTDTNKRRTSKFTVSQALYLQEEEDVKKQRSMASIKRAREKQRLQELGEANLKRKKVVKEVVIGNNITIQSLANKMAERTSDVIKLLMTLNVTA